MAENIVKKNVSYIDIQDSTPVNFTTASGGIVNKFNFISAVAQDIQVIILPYASTSNTQYGLLKNTELEPVEGVKTIRVYYI